MQHVQSTVKYNKSSYRQRLNTVSPSSMTLRHCGAQTGSCGPAGPVVSGPKQACALSAPTGDSPEVHLAGDKTPNVLIKSLNPRARPPPCLGQRRGVRENREKRTGSCPSHPSSWPAAHQHPLLCPQNTHQNATVTELMLTQCERTISKRERERGESTATKQNR